MVKVDKDRWREFFFFGGGARSLTFSFTTLTTNVKIKLTGQDEAKPLTRDNSLMQMR